MVDLTFFRSGQVEHMGHVTPFFHFIKPGMDLKGAAIYYLPNFPEKLRENEEQGGGVQNLTV